MGEPERYASMRGAQSLTKSDLSADQPTCEALADDAALLAALAACFSSALAESELMTYWLACCSAA